MFRALRIFILLLIFASVALGAWRERSRSVEWKNRLPVIIYPINGDGTPVAASYLRSLSAADFKPIESFMREEALRHGRTSSTSIEIVIGNAIATLPPQPPRDGNPLEVIAWSLQMRWWAYRNVDSKVSGTHVRMFVLFFDPAQNHRLSHSTGLQQGLIGRVNAFASAEMGKQNNVVIAHEFLHTLGATDKYDTATNQPVFPDGYAEPDLVPLLPQRFSEIMAGRTPLSASKAETPASLDDSLIGSRTAQEINWR